MKYEDVKIGQMVFFRGHSVIDPCVGEVLVIYPPDPADYPEDEGFAEVKPNQLPKNWPYSDYITFAPSIGDIEPIKGYETK